MIQAIFDYKTRESVLRYVWNICCKEMRRDIALSIFEILHRKNYFHEELFTPMFKKNF